MSKRHPVVAVTGSSGAGTSTVKRAFEHIFAREGITPAVVEGDSYHRYERMPMKQAMADALARGENFSHFGPEANLFDKLEELFRSYGETGAGQKRYYLHSAEEAAEHNARLGVNLDPGQFTPWEDIPGGTDVLFYEGLHGGVVGDGYDVASLADLLVGVVPITNLEWIQTIQRDKAERGHAARQGSGHDGADRGEHHVGTRAHDHAPGQGRVLDVLHHPLPLGVSAGGDSEGGDGACAE